MSGRPLLLLGLGAAAAVVLFVVLRPDGDGRASAPAATSNTPAAAGDDVPAATTEAPSKGPPPAPKAPTVRVTIRDGELVGGLRRITIRRGRTLVLVVRSDVRDHVHVHGLDVFRDVGPGMPARFRLTPTVAGRYEIELEDRGFLVAQLDVTP